MCRQASSIGLLSKMLLDRVMEGSKGVRQHRVRLDGGVSSPG